MNSEKIKLKIINKKLKVGVLGLGYVGLPLSLEFSKKNIPVIGFDSSMRRIEELKKNHDVNGEFTKKELKN